MSEDQSGVEGKGEGGDSGRSRAFRRQGLVSGDGTAGDLFHYFMILVLLAIVFVLGGSLFWFLLNHTSEHLTWTRAKSRAVGQGQFFFGGFLSVVWAVKRYWKPLSKE